MATAEFSKFAGILSAALSQLHLLGFEIALLADDVGVGELIDMVGVLRADVMKMGIMAYCMNSLRRLAGGCSASL